MQENNQAGDHRNESERLLFKQLDFGILMRETQDLHATRRGTLLCVYLPWVGIEAVLLVIWNIRGKQISEIFGITTLSFFGLTQSLQIPPGTIVVVVEEAVLTTLIYSTLRLASVGLQLLAGEVGWFATTADETAYGWTIQVVALVVRCGLPALVMTFFSLWLPLIADGKGMVCALIDGIASAHKWRGSLFWIHLFFYLLFFGLRDGLLVLINLFSPQLFDLTYGWGHALWGVVMFFMMPLLYAFVFAVYRHSELPQRKVL